MSVSSVKGGCSFIGEQSLQRIVTPEDITEEQQMMVDMTRDFMENEVIPHEEQLEKLDYDLTRKLLLKAAELGLLGVDVPEQYGGLEFDKVTGTHISEALSRCPGFTITIGTQTGIGSLPIVYFGNDEQKRKYLPDIVSGRRIGAYCLTEPSSGSDALSAKTTAVLSEDGKHYILNGSKIFITNGALADIFIVYAKVDGQKFSAFIVERGMPGFEIGPEEKKMGIKSSSTCSLFFENVHVPAENLLGEIGKGHLIAFNILNIGRHKLSVNCLGYGKEALSLSAKHASARTQFGTPIAQFPLIGKKLAEMNIRLFALETLVYRMAGHFDEKLGEVDQSYQAFAEYAVECSICKVFGSEVLDFVVDEGVQIHGGYGYTQEYKIERLYRDSRINRIFEGTNEINRLLITGTLFKRAAKSDLMRYFQMSEAELLQHVPQEEFSDWFEELQYKENTAKKMFYMVAGKALQIYADKLEKEQETAAYLADMLIQIYAIDSLLLRMKQIAERYGEEKAELPLAMTRVFVQEAFDKIAAWARCALAGMETGDKLRKSLAVLSMLAQHTPIDTGALKRAIAKRVSEKEGYVVM